MPRLKIEHIHGENPAWLGSTHGTHNAVTATLNPADFTTSTHFPKGHLPSGLPVNAATLTAVKPYTGAEGELLGFLLTDQSTDGKAKIAVPVLTHGIIRKSKLPVTLATTEHPAQQAQFTILP